MNRTPIVTVLTPPHAVGGDAYIKFYQLLSVIKTLLGHKETGIKSKQRVE